MSLTIEASDQGKDTRNTAQMKITISIEDINDKAPVITTKFLREVLTLETGMPGSSDDVGE